MLELDLYSVLDFDLDFDHLTRIWIATTPPFPIWIPIPSCNYVFVFYAYEFPFRLWNTIRIYCKLNFWQKSNFSQIMFLHTPKSMRKKCSVLSLPVFRICRTKEHAMATKEEHHIQAKNYPLVQCWNQFKERRQRGKSRSIWKRIKYHLAWQISNVFIQNGIIQSVVIRKNKFSFHKKTKK